MREATQICAETRNLQLIGLDILTFCVTHRSPSSPHGAHRGRGCRVRPPAARLGRQNAAQVRAQRPSSPPRLTPHACSRPPFPTITQADVGARAGAELHGRGRRGAWRESPAPAPPRCAPLSLPFASRAAVQEHRARRRRLRQHRGRHARAQRAQRQLPGALRRRRRRHVRARSAAAQRHSTRNTPSSRADTCLGPASVAQASAATLSEMNPLQ